MTSSLAVFRWTAELLASHPKRGRRTERDGLGLDSGRVGRPCERAGASKARWCHHKSSPELFMYDSDNHKAGQLFYCIVKFGAVGVSRMVRKTAAR